MIEKHVTSLDISKRVKELGYPQKSMFYWVADDKFEKFPYLASYAFHPGHQYLNHRKSWSAPTASELLDELPRKIKIIEDEYYDLYKNDNDEYIIRYDTEKHKISKDYLTYAHDKILANALAKMWIYLKENGLIDTNEPSKKS